MISQQGVKSKELTVLRLMLASQPYAWIDAFINNKGNIAS
jgi:hypothetical protein